MRQRSPALWPAFLLLSLLLTACGPDALALQATVDAAAAATLTALPTATAYPSATPQATFTPLPTHTPYATATPYATHTPYPTHTPWPTYTPFPSPTATPTATATPTPPPTAPPAAAAPPAGPSFNAAAVREAISLYDALRHELNGECEANYRGRCIGYIPALHCSEFVPFYDGFVGHRNLPNRLNSPDADTAYTLFQAGVDGIIGLVSPWREACGLALGRGDTSIGLHDGVQADWNYMSWNVKAHRDQMQQALNILESLP